MSRAQSGIPMKAPNVCVCTEPHRDELSRLLSQGSVLRLSPMQVELVGKFHRFDCRCLS